MPKPPRGCQNRAMSDNAAKHKGSSVGELSLEELTARIDLPVRTIRFYTSRGLLPAPLKRGRSAYYTAAHVSRLELVRELQNHGFTLAAIEGYLARIPADATPETIALHRTLLAPWMPDLHEDLTRKELETRTGRPLSDDDLDTLFALGIVEPIATGPGGPTYRVAAAHLSLGAALLDLGLPREAAVAAQHIFTEHGRAIATELTEVFRQQVWPAYKETGAPPEHVRELVERYKPVTIAALITAYELAVTETKRQTAAQRTVRPSAESLSPTGLASTADAREVVAGNLDADLGPAS